MEATRDCQATLVDLLDRVLEKGLVLHADIIISVSGIPLIGLKLSALLASVDTMIEYGMWTDWDCAIRAAALDEGRYRKAEEDRILHGEMPQLRILCSCRQDASRGEVWSPGTLYLTGSWIVVTERSSSRVMFESERVHLEGVSLENVDPENPVIPCLHLILKDGMVFTLRSPDAPVLVEEIGREMREQGLSLTLKKEDAPGIMEESADSGEVSDSKRAKFQEGDRIGVLCNER